MEGPTELDSRMAPRDVVDPGLKRKRQKAQFGMESIKHSLLCTFGHRCSFEIRWRFCTAASDQGNDWRWTRSSANTPSFLHLFFGISRHNTELCTRTFHNQTQLLRFLSKGDISLLPPLTVNTYSKSSLLQL